MPTDPTQYAPFPVFDANSSEPVAINSLFLNWMVAAADELPDYWSRARDKRLRVIWRTNDILKLAVSTFLQKLQTVPFFITPLSNNVESHIRQAAALDNALRTNSGIGKGWNSEISKFVTDVLTQDNGGFLCLLGGGDITGPIVGMCQGVVQLDAGLCVRTGNPVYPVRYYNPFDKKEYRIYHTRVIAMSMQPAPEADMYNVGLCPISVALDSAREIANIVRYYEEKMGARPMRQILYVKKGATIDQISGAIDTWRIKLDSESNDLFAQTLVVAPRYPTQEFDLGVLDMASTPDGFNRHETVTVDSAIVAASFGLSLSDLSLNLGSGGQTLGEANLSHLKAYSKGVATFLEQFVAELRAKVVPDHLAIEFDYVDDAQDERRAKIQQLRSDTRSRDLQSGALNPRVARLQMVRNSELTEDEFNELELTDGRMPNGTDVIYLFYSQDPFYRKTLDIGVEKPLDTFSYDPFTVLETINEKIAEVIEIIESAANAKTAFMARAAHAALVKLRNRIEGEALSPLAMTTDENTLSDGAAMGSQIDGGELFGAAEDQADANANAAGQDETIPARNGTQGGKQPSVVKKQLTGEPVILTHGDIAHAYKRLRTVSNQLADLFEARNA